MKQLYIFLLAAFSLTAFASGITATGKIDHMYVNNEWSMVHLTGVQSNPDNCQSTAYYAIRPGEKNYEVLHSTLLAAHLSGKSVKFWVNGCGGQNNQYPRIVSVWMY
ncbi:hypothetical protein SOPP22_01480 [Shewanella sp. OPT22]|nr:hypothetical protein SOPP22_01480 [Shewanella sp. OPT22]